jgi:hypothetical protein
VFGGQYVQTFLQSTNQEGKVENGTLHDLLRARTPEGRKGSIRKYRFFGGCIVMYIRAAKPHKLFPAKVIQHGAQHLAKHDILRDYYHDGRKPLNG